MGLKDFIIDGIYQVGQNYTGGLEMFWTFDGRLKLIFVEIQRFYKIVLTLFLAVTM